MTVVLEYLLVLLALGWAASQLWAAWGWSRLRRRSSQRQDPQSTVFTPFVSVIVTARNEEKNIEDCLATILQNDYPTDRFEVLVIDDYSTDRTADRVRQHAAPVPVGAAAAEETRSVRVVRAQHGQQEGNKLLALQEGVDIARGEIILTTDADCRVGSGWIRAMTRPFDDQTAMVAGPVCFHSTTSLFEKLQAVEFMGLIAYGAGCIGAGGASICNSANLAYRRTAYRHLQAEEAHPAGDELLLQELAYDTDADVNFQADPAAVVRTRAARTLSDFWNQRVRWASMGTRYPKKRVVAAAFLAWSFHALLLLCTAGMIFVPTLALPVVVAWILKLGSDALLSIPVLRHFDQHHLIRYFPVGELLYPLYITAIGIGGTFGSFRWKS